MNIMYDENNIQIQLGDTLRNDDGYHVTVVADENDGHWYGKLICDPEHSCADIGYHLNNGIGHVVVNDVDKVARKRLKKSLIDKELQNTIDGMMGNAEHHLEQYKEFDKQYLTEGYDAYHTYIFWYAHKTALDSVLHEKYLIERDRG